MRAGNPSNTQPCILKPTLGPPLDPISASPDACTVLGRSLQCDVVLGDALVSRRHAQVECHGGIWTITDLHSSHGTFVDDVRIAPQQPTVLEHGDVVSIGPWRFHVAQGGKDASFLATLDDTAGTQTIQPVAGLAHQHIAAKQLELLLECASHLTTTHDEHALAELVLPAITRGAGVHRAALLQAGASTAQVQCIGYVEGGMFIVPEQTMDANTLPFSRSLLTAAAAGETVRIETQRDAMVHATHSIAEMGVATAICAPVFIGDVLAAYVYVDTLQGQAPVSAAGEAFCQAMARLCGLALANLRRDELEQRSRKIEAHLRAAHDTQRLIVPAHDGQLGAVCWAMQMRPGMYVAGDLFDVVQLEDERIAVCIGDVTGEGVDAAVLMAATQAHLHAALNQATDPAQAVRMVNRYITLRSPMNRFVTLWVGCITPDGVLQYVDAGHGHWARVRGGTVHRPDHRGGIPLGIDEAFAYESETLHLEPHDRMVLLTDGILEQANEVGEAFDWERVAGALADSDSVATDVRVLFEAVDAWRGAIRPNDDMSIASFQITQTPSR
jgi:sigma-B regulation protein RsbU (phosphoserine phosphatase)